MNKVYVSIVQGSDCYTERLGCFDSIEQAKAFVMTACRVIDVQHRIEIVAHPVIIDDVVLFIGVCK